VWLGTGVAPCGDVRLIGCTYATRHFNVRRLTVVAAGAAIAPQMHKHAQPAVYGFAFVQTDLVLVVDTCRAAYSLHCIMFHVAHYMYNTSHKIDLEPSLIPCPISNGIMEVSSVLQL
jgi:hypothetical protein